ncbi:MAG: transcriptional regulator Spx [Acholeplasmatales bacterium]|nr:transcriptional regulator Spx [Acholeplasmatales bacterium]
MITVYTTNSCSSCKKAIKWLKDHQIKFTEKNLFTEPITKQDIKIMLENTENGFDDIISTRSKVFQNLNVSIDDMTYNELVDFIISNPSVLRRPIIVDDRKMQIGYIDD